MKKILPTLALVIILLGTLSIVPTSVSAQTAVNPTTPVGGVGASPKLDYSGFVKCDGVVDPKEPNRQTACNFATLMTTIQSMVNWMFVISVPIATVLFAYAGLLYMTGTPGHRSKANKIFTNVGIGFIIMVSAYFIVRTTVGWFVDSNSSATLFLNTTQ